RISDGASVWGEHYDLARPDLLGLEDTIAGKIATALRVEISAAERERLYRRYTANPAAYELYLKGRAELARLTRESTLAAVDAFELNRSLEMPHYYLAVAFYHLGLFDLVEPEVRAGLEINPANRAEALRVRGSTALFSGHFQEAERHLTELRQLSSSQVSDWYLAQAIYYDGEAGRAEEVLAALHGSAQAERRAQATLASFLAARHDNESARK